MKKFTKFCLIIAAVLLVLGAGLSVVAVSMGAGFRTVGFPIYYHNDFWGNSKGWDTWDSEWSGFRDEWDTSMDEIDQELDKIPEEVKRDLETDFVVEEEKTFKGVEHLDLEIEAGVIQMLVVDSIDEIQVKIGRGHSDYQLGMDGDTLKVKSYWRNKHLTRGDMRQIQILIPKDYSFNEAEVEVSAGMFMAEELIAEELDVEMKAGAAWISGGNVKRFHGECKAGALNYQGYATQEVKADCAAGKIDISIVGKETDYDYKISASAGSIILGNNSYSSLRQKRNITNTDSQGDMELKCSAGSVRVTFADEF